ncbi:hypothetical protein D918_02538 [Trichuris suis]|nr:hypothetical protein D918_02538 [Trichuris suis]
MGGGQMLGRQMSRRPNVSELIYLREKITLLSREQTDRQLKVIIITEHVVMIVCIEESSTPDIVTLFYADNNKYAWY